MTTTAQTTIPDDALLTALRGQQETDELCQALGATREEFAEARQAYLQRRLPPANARLKATVKGPVEILRDRAGVPHVFADTTADLYFGLGFAMAQDRLWQMDRLRRRALGRQAEIMGPAYLKSDLTHLLVGIDRIAAAEVEQTDARTRLLIEALVAGINRQIEACGKNLPVEFALLEYEPEPFTARDAIAILRGIWWSLNGRLESIVAAEAARLLPNEAWQTAYLTPEAPDERIVPPGSPYPPADLTPDAIRDLVAGTGDSSGSNNWAVAGSRTGTGQPVLGSDPHQPFWLPSSWYEFGLHGPEDDVAGAGHPGVPGLWWGSNGDLAWGLTNNGTMTRDLYQEEVRPDDPSQYRDGNRWLTFDEQTLNIPVRGAPVSRHTRRVTKRGPIMNEVLPSVAEAGDPPLALRWVGHEHLDDVRAAVAIGRARTGEQFHAALRDWAVAVFNFVYAERDGGVGYQCAGRIPLRGRAVRGYRDANNPADAWQGYVPYEAMPRLVNPERGFVASANNRVTADDYPYPFYGVFAPGYRAMRIIEVVNEAKPFTGERSQALQHDVVGVRARRFAPLIADRLNDSSDPDVRQVVSLLTDWDGAYRLDSSAPAVFETLMALWQERVAAEQFPQRLVSLMKSQSGVAARLLNGDDLGWFSGDAAAALAETAKMALARLRDRYGNDAATWQWGNVHHAHWTHPLSNDGNAAAFDIGPAPVAGSGDTVCNTGLGQPPEFSASGGVEYRLAVDFAQPDRFLAVQNAGNSGQPGSPHYADQFGPWLAGEYHTVALKRDDIERDVEGTTVLAPDSGNA